MNKDELYQIELKLIKEREKILSLLDNNSKKLAEIRGKIGYG